MRLLPLAASRGLASRRGREEEGRRRDLRSDRELATYSTTSFCNLLALAVSIIIYSAWGGGGGGGGGIASGFKARGEGSDTQFIPVPF